MIRRRAYGPRHVLAMTCVLAWVLGSACADDAEHAHKHASSTSVDAGETEAGAADGGVGTDAQTFFADVTSNGLNAVWGSSREDVWAVGSKGTIVHYDGHTLTTVESHTASDLHAIRGSGPDDIWAVGGEGVTLHWDGVEWREYAAKDELYDDEVLLGIWSNGPGDVWVVGVIPLSRAGVMRHWDGETWSDQAVPGSSSLWEVWASGPNDIWVVGTDPNQQGLVYRGDGMTFQRLEFDGHPLRGLWGTSGDDVWLVPYDSPLQHWDGSAFSNLETLHLSALDTDGMLGSWGFSPDNIWAVGLEGTIVHYDGAGWERVPTPSDVTLWSIWGLAPDDIWVAGGRGTLLRWDGSNWREFSAGTVKEDER